jgi:hypothetical protein
MVEKDAFEVIQQYINGWKQNNLKMITSCLIENCIVIESHGPTYHGIRDIELWFKYWLEAKSVVSRWNIDSFTFCEKQQTAFCEWDFACVSNSVGYALPGVSVVKFSGNKIAFIHEYRMTQPAYEWRGDKLKSE